MLMDGAPAASVRFLRDIANRVDALRAARYRSREMIRVWYRGRWQFR